MMPRFFYLAYLIERLDPSPLAQSEIPVERDELCVAMRAAATGDRKRFERVVEREVPEELRPVVRALAEQIVFAELDRRTALAAMPSPSKRPHPWSTWHFEVRVVLERLIGLPEDADPSSS